MAPMRTTLLLAAGLVSQAAAHGFFRSWSADGKTCDGYNPNYHVEPTCMYKIPTDTDNGFVDAKGYRSRDIICHKGAQSDDLTLTVEAGHTMTGVFTKWPESHHGPIIQSIANCNGDCKDADLEELGFNVISKKGLYRGVPGVPDGKFTSNTVAGYWGLDEFREADSVLKVTVPKWLKPGNYIWRSEFIALHSAMPTGSGAQHYPQCVNIVVTGSGTDPLNGGSSPMTWYEKSHPGLTINVFRNPTKYTIPGPDVYVSGQGGNSDNTPNQGSMPDKTTTPEPSVTPTPATTAKPSTTPTADKPVDPKPTPSNDKPVDTKSSPSTDKHSSNDVTVGQLLAKIEDSVNSLKAKLGMKKMRRHARDVITAT